MGIDSRQINATVEIDVIEKILKISRQERRSFSAMVAILLIEAVEIRENQKEYKP